MKKGEQDDAGIMVREMIARIQKAGNELTSNRLQMVIAKSLKDENKAEGAKRGGAHKGNSEGEGAAQQDKNNYLLAEPRLAEAHDFDSSTVVQRTGQDRSPMGPLTPVGNKCEAWDLLPRHFQNRRTFTGTYRGLGPSS